MNRLKGTRCYLSGPMECLQDEGKQWRLDMEPFLRSLGVGVFNPCDKPTPMDLQETTETNVEMKKLWAAGRYDECVPWYKSIVGVDLRMVHLSDFLIAYINKDVFMFGTTVEITWAVQQRKPVLCVVEQGKAKAPGFAIGMIPHQEIFSTFDECKAYLNNVNWGMDVSQYRRWQFFDQDKIMGV